MTTDIPAISHSSPANPDRQDVLNEITLKWSKFSQRDLIDITTNHQLVGEIVERYGIKKKTAQRQVDILLDGRNFSP